MKQIVVPLSVEAMKKLDYDQADDNELYVFKLSEQEVNLLFEKNFFDKSFFLKAKKSIDFFFAFLYF